jgi:hypothetical protein
MSKLVLPAGIAPANEPTAEDLPKGVLDSIRLLQVGFEATGIRVLRKRMNDGSDTIAYDLAVEIPHPITGETRLYIVAQIIPQHPKEQPVHESDATSVQPPADLD